MLYVWRPCVFSFVLLLEFRCRVLGLCVSWGSRCSVWSYEICEVLWPPCGFSGCVWFYVFRRDVGSLCGFVLVCSVFLCVMIEDPCGDLFFVFVRMSVVWEGFGSV